MSWFDEATIAYPPNLTWQEAMVVRYYYTEGAKTRDRMVAWKKMVDDIYTQHGFLAYNAADRLRTTGSPILLRTDPAKPGADFHRLPEICFRDPGPLFDCINAAERSNNEQCEREAKEIAAAKAAGKGVCEPLFKMVPISPKPSIHETVGVALGRQECDGPVADAQIGGIVQTPEGPAQIVVGPDGLPALRRLGFVKESPPQVIFVKESPPQVIEESIPEPKRPVKVKPAAVAKPAKGKNGAKRKAAGGHRVA